MSPLVSMLDQRGQVLSADFNFCPNKDGCMITNDKLPVSIYSMQKKNTVKELLMLRRQQWKPEHRFKVAKYDDVPKDASPQMPSPPALVNPNAAATFAPYVPENVFVSTQHIQPPMQCPALQGQDVPAPDFKMTLFHWQIQQEAKKAECLTAEQLNMQDSDGDTFLHIAVAQGRRALAYVLAAKMARCGSLDTKEHNGQTALQIAAATNQHLILCDLLSHSAQINIRDLWGRSPLHVCAEKGYFHSLQSIYKTVTGSDQLADVEMFNYDGLTPLHVAVLSHNAVVKEMRKLENPCSYMTSELAHKRRMYVECIRTLMHMGASYGSKDLKSGRTCIHMASEDANLELLNIFLQQPTSLALVNVKTFSGNTALHIVSSLQSYKGQVEAVKLLMRKGADPGARNYENELPCQLVPEGPVGEKVRQILKGKDVHV
ncbi:NF-kappa-B inhibitor zeta [Kryptolebias marmoratus]|uniref:NF-kappa-B inhibitor zeta n=1 Tax=Kryptolebias marmoratus TaxID=37003 RepID=UPI0007F91868|nr:NF-kappa-B inhibitor zeta [Kryptolebias marmoratus]